MNHALALIAALWMIRQCLVCLGSKAVVICSKDHWTFSETAEASTNQQVALNLSCLLLFYTLIAVQENQITLEQSQAECRETLHKLLPNVPLPDEQVCTLGVFSAVCVLFPILRSG